MFRFLIKHLNDRNFHTFNIFLKWTSFDSLHEIARTTPNSTFQLASFWKNLFCLIKKKERQNIELNSNFFFSNIRIYVFKIMIAFYLYLCVWWEDWKEILNSVVVSVRAFRFLLFEICLRLHHVWLYNCPSLQNRFLSLPFLFVCI